MDIIIGITSVNKSQTDNIFIEENDNVLIYCENLLDGIMYYNKYLFNNAFIRTHLNSFDNIKLSTIQKNINYSIIIDANAKIELIETLILNGFKFELFISNEILSNNDVISKIIKYVSCYDIQLRISKRTGNLYNFMSKLTLLQNDLLLNNSEIILKPLTSALKSSNATITCKFVNITNDMLLDFPSTLSGSTLYENKEAEISNSNLEYTLLPSVRWDDKEAYIYIRDLEFKKISSRLISRKNETKETINNSSYDLILVYADRLRNRIAAPYPPIGLYYLNSIVKQNGYSCKVIECTECNFQSTFNNHIKDRCKVVGFYCACNNEYLVSNMIKYIKRKTSDLPVIIGGPQTVALSEPFIKDTNVDIISVGEGEETTVELLDYYIKQVGCLADIKNIKYIENTNYYENPIRDVISNLDALPFAKIKHTDVALHNTINRIFILTGRGCPNRCTFCYEGANSRKVRYRSMENVFEEINYLLKEFPLAGLLHVLDDTFTCNEKRVIDFCTRMKEIRKNRNIEWVCEAHINTIYNKPKLLKTMIDSGLKGFQIGLESGSDDVLKAYRKNTSVKMIKEFINTCISVNANIFIEGNIIIGGPFESYETIKKSLDLCKYLISKGRGLVELQALSFVPLPNTDITLNPNKYGLKLLWDKVEISTLAMLDIVTETTALSRKQLHDAKENFNSELRKHYISEVTNFTPELVMRFWDYQNHQFLSASQWGTALNVFEHFKNYALAKSHEDIIAVEKNQYIIPIRTFESIEYINDTLQKYSFNISKIEREILLYANGKRNLGEIADILSMKLNEVLIYSNKLENKCMLKYSVV